MRDYATMIDALTPEGVAIVAVAYVALIVLLGFGGVIMIRYVYQ